MAPRKGKKTGTARKEPPLQPVVNVNEIRSLMEDLSDKEPGDEEGGYDISRERLERVDLR